MATYLYRITNPNVERDHRFIKFTSSQPLRAARIHRMILEVLETSARLREAYAAHLLDYLVGPRRTRTGDRFLAPYLEEIYKLMEGSNDSWRDCTKEKAKFCPLLVAFQVVPEYYVREDDDD